MAPSVAQVLEELSAELGQVRSVVERVERRIGRGGLPVEERGCVRVREAGDYLGLAERTVRDMLLRGDLPWIVVGSEKRVPMKALRQYLADRVAESERSVLAPRRRTVRVAS